MNVFSSMLSRIAVLSHIVNSRYVINEIKVGQVRNYKDRKYIITYIGVKACVLYEDGLTDFIPKDVALTHPLISNRSQTLESFFKLAF